MIMGIPNVGKSTLMNALLKKRVAKVGDEPAVTKIQQRLYLGNNMVLIDTPGMMWPKIAHPSDGLMLAASHAIGSNALIEEEVASILGDLLLMYYPKLLTARYGFATVGMDGVGVVEGVAQRRGFKLKGGDWDFEKAAHTLLQDYRSGALGRISLETPQSREHLLATYRPAPSLGVSLVGLVVLVVVGVVVFCVALVSFFSSFFISLCCSHPDSEASLFCFPSLYFHRGNSLPVCCAPSRKGFSPAIDIAPTSLACALYKHKAWPAGS